MLLPTLVAWLRRAQERQKARQKRRALGRASRALRHRKSDDVDFPSWALAKAMRTGRRNPLGAAPSSPGRGSAG